MRIGIDAREIAGGRQTGVGRYLSQILEAWADTPAAAAHEFTLFAPQPVSFSGITRLRANTVTAAGRGTIWEQFVLPRLVRAAEVDVLFAPAYTGPLRITVPMVLTVHDVSFAAHPEWFSWREGTRRRLVSRWSASRAARVITVSDFSKREIVRCFAIDQSKIEVIYLGATPFARPRPRERLVLSVGSLFNRRHVPQLIAGFARLVQRHPDIRLEVVGDNRTLPRLDIDGDILKSGAADRIRARAYVSDDELADLYSRASAFAFLSSYEGFGMTPLDALAAGVPIVVLDNEVAREIYGPAAVYVELPEPALIAQALERALFDPAERARILEGALPQLGRYSWDECARRTLQVLLAAGSEKSKVENGT
jgi:glycosyltransferase involved in cell wall biosynthesis